MMFYAHIMTYTYRNRKNEITVNKRAPTNRFDAPYWPTLSLAVEWEVCRRNATKSILRPPYHATWMLWADKLCFGLAMNYLGVNNMRFICVLPIMSDIKIISTHPNRTRPRNHQKPLWICGEDYCAMPTAVSIIKVKYKNYIIGMVATV